MKHIKIRLTVAENEIFNHLRKYLYEKFEDIPFERTKQSLNELLVQENTMTLVKEIEDFRQKLLLLDSALSDTADILHGYNTMFITGQTEDVKEEIVKEDNNG